MRVLILTAGTRGDVQPYLALGLGLQAAGHVVTLGTSQQFGTLIQAYGLPHAAFQADFDQLLGPAEGQRPGFGRNPLRIMRQLSLLQRQLLDESWAAAQDAEAVIYHPKAMAGYHIAEKLSVPGFLAHPVPLLSPTRVFPNPALPVKNLGGRLNYASYTLFLRLATASYRRVVNTWRRETLDRPPMQDDMTRDGQPIPKLYAYSPRVVPTPPDWDNTTIITGYWFLPHRAQWQPSAELQAFLANGPAPVYVGFGSMAELKAIRTAGVVLAALAQVGQRAVVSLPPNALAGHAIPDSVHVLAGAPHDWLFPQMAAVMHHGGAGTTAAALQAGKPQIICPFFGDQSFWGRRTAALGVGVEPLPHKKLNVKWLLSALERVFNDTNLQHRAGRFGSEIRLEDGVGNAVAAIQARL